MTAGGESRAVDVDVDVDADVAFATLAGEPLTLHVERVTVTGDDGEPSAVVLEALADATAWARLDAGALLHLDADARGPSLLAGGFETGEPVRIRAVLDRIVMRSLDGTEPATIAARLRGEGDGGDDDPLLHERSWWALDVSGRVTAPPQLGGELYAGFPTIWTAEPPPAGMATVVAAVLDEAEITPSVEETDDGSLIVRFSTADAIGLAVLREAAQQAIVYLVLPQMCPPDRRDELARLAALVNFDLPIGCLEVNLEFGQVRVRTSADVRASSAQCATSPPRGFPPPSSSWTARRPRPRWPSSSSLEGHFSR